MLENVTTLSPQDGSKPAPNATAVTGASPRAVAASASVQRGLRHICTPCFDRIQPAANLPTKLPTIAARSWGSRKERIGADSKALVRRLDDQQSLKRQRSRPAFAGRSPLPTPRRRRHPLKRRRRLA